MGFLFDILMEVITACLPGRNHDDRSIVGESRLDRNARMWAAVVITVVLVIGAGVYLYWKFLR